MKKSKFSEEQIAYALREVEGGRPAADVCRQMAVSEVTFYIWKRKYGHLGVTELRRLRQLEDENNRLKRLVAEATETHGVAPRAGADSGGADRLPSANASWTKSMLQHCGPASTRSNAWPTVSPDMHEAVSCAHGGRSVKSAKSVAGGGSSRSRLF